MPQDLPFFKFNASKYNAGEITVCSLAAQGLFINLCSLYWSRDCSLNKAFAVKRIIGYQEPLFDELITAGILQLSPDQTIRIGFLDEQFSELTEAAKKGADLAAKRWQKDPANAGGNATRNAGRNAESKATGNASRNGKREEKIREDNTSLSKKGGSISTSNGTKSPPMPLSALLGPGGKIGSDWMSEAEKRSEEVNDKFEAGEIPRDKFCDAFLYAFPIELEGDLRFNVLRFFETAEKEKAEDLLLAAPGWRWYVVQQNRKGDAFEKTAEEIYAALKRRIA